MKFKRTAAALIASFCVIAFGAESCDSQPSADSHSEGQKQTEQAFKQQSGAVPYPVNQLKDSLERRNLRERLLRQNDPNRIGYVYILSFGKFIGYYTIKGKVSSTESQMTPSDLVSNDLSHCSGCSEHIVTEAPGDDGSYGPNEQGVFFFTTQGVMVQVSTDYIYSDQPLTVGNVPQLTK